MVSGPGEEALLSLPGDGSMSSCAGLWRLPLHELFCPVHLAYSASSGCYWGKCSFCPENPKEHLQSGAGSGVVRDLRVLLREGNVLVHFWTMP